jgi:DNA polymerase IV
LNTGFLFEHRLAVAIAGKYVLVMFTFDSDMPPASPHGGASPGAFPPGGRGAAAGHADAFRWLYVDFNSYFASVEQQLQPHLRGQPIAVVPVDTDATCAIAASYEAKAFGVKTGTLIHEAKKMCPGLICVLARHEAYVAFHKRIVAEIERHIPVTAVCSIDEMACWLMDNEASQTAAIAIARSIKQGLACNIGEHVRCSIGIAPNRYLAKVATDLQKPDGLTLLRLADLPARLLPLALRDLPGIGHNIEKRLLAAGIPDMATLWALSPERMRKVWGSIWGERMWHLLRGADLPEIETARRSVGHSHVMAPEFRAPDKARHVARRLILKAGGRLRRMGYRAAILTFSARVEHGPRLSAEARCEPCQDSFTFLSMLEQAWRTALLDWPGARLKKVSIVLHGLSPAGEPMPDLFDFAPERRARRKGEQLSHALDRLNLRFGRDTVLVGLLPSQGRSFAGTKIAFTRIPDIEEFLE